MDTLRKNGEGWKVYLMFLPSYVFLASSCCLVPLIVLLRLLAVKRPMNFKSAHAKFSCIGSVIVWAVSLFVFLIPFVICIYDKNEINMVCTISHNVASHLLNTLPILATVIIYFILIWTLKHKTDTAATGTSLKKRSLAKMTKGIVVCLVACNLPYIALQQYVLVFYLQGNVYAAYDTTLEVPFLAIL